MFSSQKWRLSFIFVVLTSLLPTLVKSQGTQCFRSNGNYTSNSTYSYNLNTLLSSSLPSNISTMFGFGYASVGENPDRANAIAFCRADVQPGQCRECIRNATTDLLNSCPNQKQALMWRDNICMLRYSNEYIYGVRDDFLAYTMMIPDTVTSPEQFNRDLRELLVDIRGEAASGGSLIKIAAGNHTAPDFQTIYALSQCTPDITEEECTGCLNEAAQLIPGSANSTGVGIFQLNCHLRYETGPFYNKTRIQEAQSAALLPPPRPLPGQQTNSSSPSPLPGQQTNSSSPSPLPGKGDHSTTQNVIIIVVVVSVSLIVAASLCIFLMRKRIKKNSTDATEKLVDDEMTVAKSLQFDFGELRAATNDFSDDVKLGQGGFGAVYKGKLQNGQQIAVKRLSSGSGQGEIEFRNEVSLMVKLQHRNLVRLLGFAIEGPERLLVYEFLENSSLDNILFDPIKRSYMDWDLRQRIIIGIAKGLLYLHEDSRLRIIHRDLKAANILLDGEMNPKIADFGTARLFEMDQSQGCTSRIVGTYGYMAPEYLMNGQFSVKSDVYSFGVLVLEIVSGQKNNNFRNEGRKEDMLYFAWRSWCEDTTTNMIDPVLRASSGSLHEMLRCIHIGLLCVQENVADRPTMASVILMLSSFSITMRIPSQPGFSNFNRSNENTSLEEHNSRDLKFKGSYRTSVGSTHFKDEASISDLYPR